MSRDERYRSAARPPHAVTILVTYQVNLRHQTLDFEKIRSIPSANCMCACLLFACTGYDVSTNQPEIILTIPNLMSSMIWETETKSIGATTSPESCFVLYGSPNIITSSLHKSAPEDCMSQALIKVPLLMYLLPDVVVFHLHSLKTCLHHRFVCADNAIVVTVHGRVPSALLNRSFVTWTHICIHTYTQPG